MEKLKYILKKTFLYQIVRNIYIAYLNKVKRNNLFRQRKKIIKTYGKKFYLNIGAGMFIKNDWRIIDYSEYGSDVVFPKNLIDFDIDLIECKKWPVPDESIDLIYSSHCLEHLGRKVVINVLSETYRVLKRGGICRITLPDMDKIYRAYKNNDLEYFKSVNKNYTNESIDTMFLKLLSPIRNTFDLRRDINSMDKCDFLDKYTPEINLKKRPSELHMHVMWFNHDILENLAKKAGFSQYIISSKGNSISPEMRTAEFDTIDYRLSLYADIIK